MPRTYKLVCFAEAPVNIRFARENTLAYLFRVSVTNKFWFTKSDSKTQSACRYNLLIAIRAYFPTRVRTCV